MGPTLQWCAVLVYSQALPADIRLGWKGLPGTNALAYYEHSQITAAKGYITLCPDFSMYLFLASFKQLPKNFFSSPTTEANAIKLLCAYIILWRNKLERFYFIKINTLKPCISFQFWRL